MAAVDIGSLIVRSPEIRGNRPRIAGTGVTVRRIVGWYKLGRSPEEIVDTLPHLTLAQVFAALAYYHANRDEIEGDIAQEEAADDEVRARDILRRYDDKSFSYVDATSFSLMERLGIRQAFSFDPHFEQYGLELFR